MAFRSKIKVYSWILSEFFAQKLQVIHLILISLFIAVTEILLPKCVEYFIDWIVPSKDISDFVLLLGVFLSVVCINILLKVRHNYLQRRIGEISAKCLLKKTLSHLRILDFKYSQDHTEGEILSLFSTDVPSVSKLFNRLFPQIIQCTLLLIVICTFLLMSSTNLTLVFFMFLPLYYMCFRKLEDKRIQAAGRWVVGRKELNSKIHESISALPDLKAFGSAGWDYKRFLLKVEQFIKVWKKQVFTNFLTLSIRQLFLSIGTLTVYIVGILLIGRNEMSVGQFISYLFMYHLLIHNAVQLLETISEQSGVYFNAQRVYSFLHEEPVRKESSVDNLEASIEINGEIEFVNVSFGYQSQTDVVENVNLRIGVGEKVVLVGESGSGKTTLLQLLGGLYEPHRGDITIGGTSIRNISKKQLKASVGYAFQDPFLFGLSVLENIRFGKPDSSELEVINSARLADCERFVQKMQHQYNTTLSERGSSLSGGERQRISLARLFLKNPRIVLLDEATAALDSESERKIMSSINTLFGDRTVIAIAHRLSSIKYFDKVFVMERGRIVESGTYEELIKRQGKFYYMLKNKTIAENQYA
ncbi:ABC transporter ATP-binding protein [Paenibacillus sp. PL2-23]|uniref:ABC transporter ATP-binding protein n=1 Tax=Paenibacillus sp. PL2-23 TaxID=2100729 RepID=UPI0030F54D7A